jgi:hypothetical protein
MLSFGTKEGSTWWIWTISVTMRHVEIVESLFRQHEGSNSNYVLMPGQISVHYAGRKETSRSTNPNYSYNLDPAATQSKTVLVILQVLNKVDFKISSVADENGGSGQGARLRRRKRKRWRWRVRWCRVG